ncbi:MAG: hypothetical protein OXE40_17530 [Gammaproteobacteria bacterium]|nr:hypothetical protein [Gammaproteobacteria bacterium]
MRARQWLARTDREADAAVRREPLNWEIEHRLARLYRVVAATEPDYEARAGRHLARAPARARSGGVPAAAGSARDPAADAWRAIQYAYGAAPNGTSTLAEEGLDLLDSLAPMLIGGMVRDLCASTIRQGAGVTARAARNASVEIAAGTVGEAPCRCGSGREKGGCCGAH